MRTETSVDLGEAFAAPVRRWWVIVPLGAAGAAAGLITARAPERVNDFETTGF